MKTKLINSLLHRYNGILRECISQKKLFSNEAEFIKTVTKLQMYINLIQGIQLKLVNHV